MMLFKPEFTMEEFKTPIEKRAFIGGLYYAMQHIQGYSAELFFDDSHYAEVPAERLRSMANDLMKVMTKVLNEATALEKTEEALKDAERAAATAPPPSIDEVKKDPFWTGIRELSNEPD